MATCAKDIMTTELILAYPEMTIEEAIKTLVNNRITGLPVVDDSRKVVGVCSEYDIIKSVKEVEEPAKPLNLKNKIKYTHAVITISESTDLKEILTIFIDKKIRRLPVLNSKEELVGIISRRDIMRVLFYRSKSL